MNIALLGAGGKMGRRLTANLRSLPDYKVCYVESSEERRELLASDGINTVPVEEAISLAAVVVLAIPDRLIGKVTHEIVPILNSVTIEQMAILEPAVVEST